MPRRGKRHYGARQSSLPLIVIVVDPDGLEEGVWEVEKLARGIEIAGAIAMRAEDEDAVRSLCAMAAGMFDHVGRTPDPTEWGSACVIWLSCAAPCADREEYAEIVKYPR